MIAADGIGFDMQKMALNAFGSAAGGLFVVGLIAYAFTGEVLDVCWLFSSLMIGLAAAAVLGQVTYAATNSNDAAANYVVAGTLMISVVLSLALKPDLSEYEDMPIVYEDNAQAPASTPAPVQAQGASVQQLRAARQRFVTGEEQTGLRISDGLNDAFLATEQVDNQTTAKDIEKMIAALDQARSLLNGLRTAIDTQNERFRREIINAGATMEQANQHAILFSKNQAATEQQNELAYSAWTELFDTSKQKLELLRDFRDNWRIDGATNSFVFSNDEALKRVIELDHRIQTLAEQINQLRGN